MVRRAVIVVLGCVAGAVASLVSLMLLEGSGINISIALGVSNGIGLLATAVTVVYVLSD